MYYCSPFWWLYALGRITLSPVFAQRDIEDVEAPAHQAPADDRPVAEEEFHRWLRLSEAERGAVVAQYATKAPPVRWTSTKERRQQTDAYSG